MKFKNLKIGQKLFAGFGIILALTIVVAVVGWSSVRIIDAINGDLNDWLSPGGEVRVPRAIRRYGC